MWLHSRQKSCQASWRGRATHSTCNLRIIHNKKFNLRVAEDDKTVLLDCDVSTDELEALGIEDHKVVAEGGIQAKFVDGGDLQAKNDIVIEKDKNREIRNGAETT